MFGQINIDPFLPVSWSRAYGNRAFQFDAFISHNREDRHSGGLAHELASRGAVIWHDHDQDLRDRRVQEAVSSALTRSRFVVVSVDDSFNDSIWCRAEYLSALKVESRAKVSGLLVAQMTPNALVPNALARAPRFECYRQGELDRLSSEIQSGNRISVDAEWDDRRTSTLLGLDDLSSLCRGIDESEEGKMSPNSMTLRFIAHLVEDGSDQRHPQQLMAARQMLIKEADLAKFSERELEFLLSSAMYICSFTDSDHRANGIMMLLHLAETFSHLRDEALRVLASETDDSLISVGFPWFERCWDFLTEKQRSVVELCALRSPIHLELYYPGSPMVAAFSDVVRAKVFAEGLDENLLLPEERMHLIGERADHVLGSPSIVAGNSGIDALCGLMGVSDLEIVFRELNDLLFDRFDIARQKSESIALGVVELVDRIVSCSLQREGMPLRAMEEYVLDFVLKPLLWCATFAAARDSAVKVFDSVCGLLEACCSLGYEVPVYKEYLAVVLSGADMSEGLHSECFQDVGLRMLRAQEKHNQQRALRDAAQKGLVKVKVKVVPPTRHTGGSKPR
jgi:hypothetical protein